MTGNDGSAGAQLAGKVYRIGYLFESNLPDPPSAPLEAFEGALREMGYVEGSNLVVERRFAAFKYDRLPELAADLVRLKPDVIVTSGNPSIAALKRATTTVPVVMAWSVDPVGARLITSLARPGGNITGTSLTPGPEFIAKQLETLKQAVRKLSRVGSPSDRPPRRGDGGDRVGGAEARHDSRVRRRTRPY